MFSEELVYAVALNKVFRYNPRVSSYLLRELGSAKAVLLQTKGEIADLFARRYSFFEDLADTHLLDWAYKEISWASSKGIRILHSQETDYPISLKECPDPPVVIYLYGNVDLNQEKIVSIVGTRMCTKAGVESCRKIIREFTEEGIKPLIVSGLAYGADIAAHRAALEYGLDTVAVLPNGIDRIYPAAHHDAARKISRQGAIVTEFPSGTESLKINFIQRNRIIAALSKATIVIESKEKGGALITAELAQSYFREVFALPGRVSDPFSAGCNKLIFRNIASIYLSTKEFIDSMEWDSGGKVTCNRQMDIFSSADPEKEKILLALSSNSELSIDELHRISGEKLQNLSKYLLELELEGKILSLAGNRYSLA